MCTTLNDRMAGCAQHSTIGWPEVITHYDRMAGGIKPTTIGWPEGERRRFTTLGRREEEEVYHTGQERGRLPTYPPW